MYYYQCDIATDFPCARSPRKINVVQPRTINVSLELNEGKVDGIKKRCQPPEAAGVGPRKALKRIGLEKMNPVERGVWMAEARLCAIMGSQQYSMDSWKSGMRCYFAFVGMCVYKRVPMCCMFASYVARCDPPGH